MALSMICEKGHHYIAPDIIRGELPPGMPLCPECAKEWRREREVKIEDLQRVHLKPGDVIILRTDACLPMRAIQEMKNRLKRLFPDNEALILDRGLEMFVAGKSD